MSIEQDHATRIDSAEKKERTRFLNKMSGFSIMAITPVILPVMYFIFIFIDKISLSTSEGNTASGLQSALKETASSLHPFFSIPSDKALAITIGLLAVVATITIAVSISSSGAFGQASAQSNKNDAEMEGRYFTERRLNYVSSAAALLAIATSMLCLFGSLLSLPIPPVNPANPRTDDVKVSLLIFLVAVLAVSLQAAAAENFEELARNVAKNHKRKREKALSNNLETIQNKKIEIQKNSSFTFSWFLKKNPIPIFICISIGYGLALVLLAFLLRAWLSPESNQEIYDSVLIASVVLGTFSAWIAVHAIDFIWFSTEPMSQLFRTFSRRSFISLTLPVSLGPSIYSFWELNRLGADQADDWFIIGFLCLAFGIPLFYSAVRLWKTPLWKKPSDNSESNLSEQAEKSDDDPQSNLPEKKPRAYDFVAYFLLHTAEAKLQEQKENLQKQVAVTTPPMTCIPDPADEKNPNGKGP